MKLHTLSVRCLLLGACLSLATCAPPYIVELNTAAGLANRMTLVGTLGIVSPGSSSASNIRFLPVKPTASDLSGVSVRSGFIVTSSSTTQNLQYVSLDSSGNAQTYGGNGFSTSDPNYPANQFEVTTTTTTANLVVLRYDADASELYTANLSDGTLQSTPGPSLSSLTAYPVLGIGVMPMPGAPDVFNFFFYSTSSQFGQMEIPINATTVFNSADAVSAFTIQPSLPSTTSRYFFYLNQAGINFIKTAINPGGALSYVSYHSGSGWTCYRWDPSASSVPAVELSGVTHRIDALLTTGDLLSTEGGTLRLYDPDGNEVLSTSLSGRQYCYEAYVGTTPYVFFSLTVSLGHGNNNYAFNVYAIPTSDMRGLGG